MIAAVPDWAWGLIFTNILTAVAIIASVRTDVKHLVDSVREAKDIGTRAHERIDLIQHTRSAVHGKISK